MTVDEMKDDTSPSDMKEGEADKSLNESSEELLAKEESSPVEEETIKPGAQLAIYREQAGLTQEEIATNLKMTVRQVRELESDNYDAFHGVTVARGFVRAYAKVLKVDPEPLVSAFREKNIGSQQVEQVARQSARATGGMGSSGATISYDKGKSSGGKIGLIILVVVIIVLAIGAYKMKLIGPKKNDKPAVTQPATPVKEPVKEEVKNTSDAAEANKSATQKVEEPKVEDKKTDDKVEKKEEAKVEVKAEEKKEEQAEKNVISEKAEASKIEATKAEAIKVESAKVEAPKVEEAKEEAKKVEAPPEPKNILSIKFNGPSKVRLYKADKTLLKEIDGKVGDAQTVEIKEPVSLVIEQALNVQTEFRGKPLLLRSARRSPEARVDLK